MSTQLRVLAVDDEAPALTEIAFLLERDERVGHVATAPDAASALVRLQEDEYDAVFLDISMPGLNGVELARVLSRFKQPPAIVFVTAHEQHALEAFELAATDYVLKPVRAERMGEAIRRVAAQRADARDDADVEDETIAVELGRVTTFVSRADVRWVEAQGDYARLHTASGSHLVRVPLTTLEEKWRDAGFVRVHRSHLVSLAHVTEVRNDSGRYSVRVGDVVLPVSRRHTRDLKDTLVKRAARQ